MQEDLSSKTILFENKQEAALKLIDILPTTKLRQDDWLLVAISTDSIPMAETIAKKLNLFYDILFMEHIYTTNNPECAIGMTSESEDIVTNEELVKAFDINIEYIYGEAHRKYEEKILKYMYQYRKGSLLSSLKDKNIILIDEGCETGLTVLTAVKSAMTLKANSVIYATPVIASNVEHELESVTDELYALHRIANFVDVEFYYKDKSRLDQDDVLEILKLSKHYLPFQKKEKTKTGDEE